MVLVDWHPKRKRRRRRGIRRRILIKCSLSVLEYELENKEGKIYD
jgi:hypothetical protein